MRNTDHLTDEQLRESMRKPLSPGAAERRRKAIEAAGWLLALNLQEMDFDAVQIIHLPPACEREDLASDSGTIPPKEIVVETEINGWKLEIIYTQTIANIKISPPADLRFRKVSIAPNINPENILVSWSKKEIKDTKPFKEWNKVILLYVKEGNLLLKVEN